LKSALGHFVVTSCLCLVACDDGETKSREDAGVDDASIGQTDVRLAADALAAADALDIEPDALPAGDAAVTDGPWGVECADDAACAAPTDFCVKQPGAPTGYCSQRCVNTGACGDAGAPEGWTCNTVAFAGCDDVATNWCGPAAEVEQFAGVVIECP
jgi:hypothetical protein